jgi:hypothetical protein
LRLRIADNKIALNGGWNPDLMKVELEAIRAEGLDLELTGFSIGEIDVMLTGQLDPSDDDIPPTLEEPVSRAGDIWICGDHRIACGDILDGNSLKALMIGMLADGAFLDAPYNVKNNGHAGGNGKIKHAEFLYASGDMSPAEFTDFLQATLGACAGVSRDGAVHFVCMDHHHTNELVYACNTVYGARLNIAVCAARWHWKAPTVALADQFRVADIDISRIDHRRTSAMNPMLEDPGQIVAVNNTEDERLFWAQILYHKLAGNQASVA